jgi:hypothetical protein
MVGERRHQDAEDDRQRLAVARRQHHGEELRLVADLGDGHEAGRNEKASMRNITGGIERAYQWPPALPNPAGKALLSQRSRQRLSAGTRHGIPRNNQVC